MNVSSLRYDLRTITLHWLTAALVVSLWVPGQTVDWFPKGNPRVFARSTHIALGVALALVRVARIGWRFNGRAVHLPSVGLERLDKIATITQRLFYALLAVTVAFGLANTWVRQGRHDLRPVQDPCVRCDQQRA